MSSSFEGGLPFGKPPFLTVISGRKAGGKSQLIRYAVYQYAKHVSYVIAISATAEVNRGYDYLPKELVFTGYDPSVVQRVIAKQEAYVKSGKTVHCLLIMDDIIGGCIPHYLAKFPELQALATTNRHWKISIMIATQSPRCISPLFRQNADFICVLSSLRPALEALAREIGDGPTAQFVQMLETYTRDYGIVTYSPAKTKAELYRHWRVPAEFIDKKFFIQCSGAPQ